MRMRILMHLGLSRFVLMVVWGLEYTILSRVLLGLRVGGGMLVSDDGADMAAAIGEAEGMLPAIGGSR